MTVTLNEVRELGFQRIWKIMIDNGDSSDSSAFFKDLRQVSSLLTICKIAPYSALNYWSAIEKLSNAEAGGFKRLMQDVAPMISELPEPDTTSKRKFRDTWNVLWLKFGEACGLEAYDVTVMSDVGIKLPIMLSAIEQGNVSAMKAIKFSTSYYSALGTEQAGVSKQDYLYNNISAIKRLCIFYNMVIGWFLSVHNETDTADLLAYLALTDFVEFADFFKNGERIWVSDNDISVNEDQINTLSGVKL